MHLLILPDNFRRRAAAGLFATLLACGALADDALTTVSSTAERGLALFTEADRRESGYEDFEVQLEMVLRNARGDEVRRQLGIKGLEVADDGDRTLVLFDEPKSIRGTALLSHAHRAEADEQWLFLPALKRVKKIAARDKSGPFLSSEFSFEDLSGQEIEKFTYNFVRDETLDGVQFHVVERKPLDQFSGYSSQMVWLDATELRIHRIEYYARNGAHLKTLEVSDYQRYLDRFWRARFMRMTNHRTNRSTDLIWSDYAFKSGLSADRDFSPNSLQRIR